jgi:hypothetical protein
LTRVVLQRILQEHRRVLTMLALALLGNVLLYVGAVRPLAARSANASARATAAATARAAAEEELERARALVTGKARADEELATFYNNVLPSDLSAARRLTYASLPELANRTRVTYVRRSFETKEVESDSRLGQLSIRVVLQGNWENIREFIYRLETAPQFVIIDDVAIVEAQPGEPLTLTLSLSTYFHLPRNGI